MNATLMKRLFRVIHFGSNADVDSLCRRIVEEQRKQGHARVAQELERILKDKPPEDIAPSTGALQRLPTSRRDSAPLVQDIPVDKLRHHMVLPDVVERRFHRIEREFAARTRLAKHGLKPRHRILLYGPPGCGKSLGAERLAWSTGLPLRKVRFDTLLSSYFGETMANLRKVFEAAQASPCALFLDECDTLARSRTVCNDVGEITRITNALLEMLESYTGDGLVIAATNIDSALDTALFRRFDEVLKVPLPGIKEISQLLKTTLSPIETDVAISWHDLSLAMDGMSGSDVVHVAQSAAKHCVLEGRQRVGDEDIRRALAEIHERHQAC
ncbi:MAG TPA: AAA family ATPase [Verrucomicrobiae bacterium]|nr:AAA family ATPase [Verrucomicrobiae bacterium]